MTQYTYNDYSKDGRYSVYADGMYVTEEHRTDNITEAVRTATQYRANGYTMFIYDNVEDKELVGM